MRLRGLPRSKDLALIYYNKPAKKRPKPGQSSRDAVKVGDFIGYCGYERDEIVGTAIAMVRRKGNSKGKGNHTVECVVISELMEGGEDFCNLHIVALAGSFPVPSPEELVEIRRKHRLKYQALMRERRVAA